MKKTDTYKIGVKRHLFQKLVEGSMLASTALAVIRELEHI